MKKNQKHTEESKRKNSESHLGEKNHNFGKHLSKETRKKISSSLSGKKRSKEERKRISDGHKGQTPWNKGKIDVYSEETLKKMSLLKLGKFLSEEHLKNISKSLIGHKVSPLTRKKIGKKILEARQRGCFHITPNKPEQKMIQIIKENDLPFNFVGDGQVILGGFNPDFLSTNPKHIIEIYGDYWHKKDKNHERRINSYSKLGYKTLIVWESELKNQNQVVNKIRKFLN